MLTPHVEITCIYDRASHPSFAVKLGTTNIPHLHLKGRWDSGIFVHGRQEVQGGFGSCSRRYDRLANAKHGIHSHSQQRLQSWFNSRVSVRHPAGMVPRHERPATCFQHASSALVAGSPSFPCVWVREYGLCPPINGLLHLLVKKQVNGCIRHLVGYCSASSLAVHGMAEWDQGSNMKSP